MWTEADKSKQEQMKINKQTNKNTQLQNKIKLKKTKQNKQNFFFVPHSWQDQKKSFFFFTQPKTYHLSHFIYILDNFSLMSFNTANLKVTMPQDKQ